MPNRPNARGIVGYAHHRGVSPALISRYANPDVDGRLAPAVDRSPRGRITINFAKADRLLGPRLDPDHSARVPGPLSLGALRTLLALEGDFMNGVRGFGIEFGMPAVIAVQLSQHLGLLLLAIADFKPTDGPGWLSFEPGEIAAAWGIEPEPQEIVQ